MVAESSSTWSCCGAAAAPLASRSGPAPPVHLSRSTAAKKLCFIPSGSFFPAPLCPCLRRGITPCPPTLHVSAVFQVQRASLVSVLSSAHTLPSAFSADLSSPAPTLTVQASLLPSSVRLLPISFLVWLSFISGYVSLLAPFYSVPVSWVIKFSSPLA